MQPMPADGRELGPSGNSYRTKSTTVRLKLVVSASRLPIKIRTKSAVEFDASRLSLAADSDATPRCAAATVIVFRFTRWLACFDERLRCDRFGLISFATS